MFNLAVPDTPQQNTSAAWLSSLRPYARNLFAVSGEAGLKFVSDQFFV